MKSAAKRASAKTSTSPSARNEVFAALRAIFAEHAPPLRILVDKPADFQIVSATRSYKGRPLWIGGVRQGKNYTSFHLMPVYAFPELVEQLSPELKRRMQGKGCFNFKTVDPMLFAELKKFVSSGIPRFDSDALLAHLQKKRD